MVSLVGAGPGDPDLITVKGLKRIQSAEVILFDCLVSRDLLVHGLNAQKILVGKSAGSADSWSQNEINDLLVSLGKQGKQVTRLKGGDPFVFGRGGEEALALAKNGIPFEVIPGISSCIAAASAAGIPVTHRGIARSFSVFTGSQSQSGDLPNFNWKHAAESPTAVFLMGVSNLPLICKKLIEHGKPIQTPVAVISCASLPNQAVKVANLSDFSKPQTGLISPAVIVVGEVVKIRQELEALSGAFVNTENIVHR